MKNDSLSRDINTFPLKAVVSVVGIPDYTNITIERISDCGVTVSGPNCGKNMIISGGSPAVYYKEGEETILEKVEDKKTSTNETNKKNMNKNKDEVPSVGDSVPKIRVERGSHKAKMASIAIPKQPFTIKQLSELNDIPQSYAYNWVKANCFQDGNLEKVGGARGRVAAVFKVNV